MPLGNNFSNYLAFGFDLCPLLEAILYSLQSFGDTNLSVIQSLEVVHISGVENVLVL